MLWRSQCAEAWRKVAAMSLSPARAAFPAASAKMPFSASEAASSVRRVTSRLRLDSTSGVRSTRAVCGGKP